MTKIQKNFTPFGGRLRAACEKAGMQHKQLAKLIGVSRNTVSAYITGSQLPSGEKLIALGDVLQVSLDWLLTGKEPEQVVPARNDIPGWLEPLLPKVAELDRASRDQLVGYIKGFVDAQAQKKDESSKRRRAS